MSILRDLYFFAYLSRLRRMVSTLRVEKTCIYCTFCRNSLPVTLWFQWRVTFAMQPFLALAVLNPNEFIHGAPLLMTNDACIAVKNMIVTFAWLCDIYTCSTLDGSAFRTVTTNISWPANSSCRTWFWCAVLLTWCVFPKYPHFLEASAVIHFIYGPHIWYAEFIWPWKAAMSGIHDHIKDMAKQLLFLVGFNYFLKFYKTQGIRYRPIRWGVRILFADIQDHLECQVVEYQCEWW